jgi:hypothetical protein
VLFGFALIAHWFPGVPLMLTIVAQPKVVFIALPVKKVVAIWAPRCLVFVCVFAIAVKAQILALLPRLVAWVQHAVEIVAVVVVFGLESWRF